MRAVVMLSMLLLAAAAQAEGAAPGAVRAPIQRYMMADPRAEIALARTAAPPSISAAATVLVLGPRGYETAVKGSNGFTCFIERSWTAGLGDPVFWDPAIRAPNCFNPAAVKTVLPMFLERTRWVLAGLGRAQITARTRAEFAAARIVAPGPGAFSFMLSRQGDLGAPAGGGAWLPHVMFFIPHGEAAAWGAGLEASPVIGAEGLAFEPTVLFIPVRRWSDGSPAPPATDLGRGK
ncbi:MAG: hypothetical protein ACYC8V_04070 [Caulobacteraceae bacterium]